MSWPSVSMRPGRPIKSEIATNAAAASVHETAGKTRRRNAVGSRRPDSHTLTTASTMPTANTSTQPGRMFNSWNARWPSNRLRMTHRYAIPATVRQPRTARSICTTRLGSP
jgi:hypothetical protein